MSRRLFYQTKLYDYSTVKEAEKHIKEMTAKGWHIRRTDKGEEIFCNSQESYPYSVEYFKEI